MTTTSNSTTHNLEDCPCCAEGEPCFPDVAVPCEHCDTQLKSFVLEFSGVVVNPGCECDQAIESFWNGTSFITANCCDCECGETRYIDDPDDPFLMGHTNVAYEATQTTVTVLEEATDIDYSDCPCNDVQAIFRKTGLTAPYDCENMSGFSFVSQDTYPVGGLGSERTDWSGATCTLSAS
jgi:hypothetical protein